MKSQKENTTQKERSQRRHSFLQQIKGGVAVLFAAPHSIRNNDVHHAYRQDSSFYYLTGLSEPESICLFNPQSKKPFTLFVEPKDKMKELWEGRMLGLEGAKAQLGADEALSSKDTAVFDEAFVEALLEADRVYYRVGQNTAQDQRVFSLMSKAAKRLGRTGRPLWPILDPADVLGEMRLIKSQHEIAALQIAANITAHAHTEAMRHCKPGMYEYEVEAALFHSFRAAGAGRLGYGSIVASGPNACVLHYVNNDRKMTDKDLLLIDAGAEFDYYTADITRCFPVGNRFSPEQREVYQSVLLAQKECVAMARPGKTLREIHLHAVEVLTEELKRLKVLKGTTKELIKSEAYRPYYPHGTGHWLGMDVHDIGRYYDKDYQDSRKLKAGMVFTVEPGLYFSLDSKAPTKLKGIGVRIEDDILITDKGHVILTALVPKEIEEIESLRS
jgi:Xaa-Pro aminopeptidase